MNQQSEVVLEKKQMEHIHRDDEGSKMGMWLFLFTEFLLFGGLFILYASYRYVYPEDFKIGAMTLNPILGAVNTIILLTSSLTVVLAILALQRNQKTFSIYMLSFTIFCGLIFLINKYLEWGGKIDHGIYPKGPGLEGFPNGEVVFIGLYYVMTGLHGLHVVAGMVFLSIILVFIVKDKITGSNYQRFENAGLYWHLVDIIWIFLFPLFYLIH